MRPVRSASSRHTARAATWSAAAADPHPRDETFVGRTAQEGSRPASPTWPSTPLDPHLTAPRGRVALVLAVPMLPGPRSSAPWSSGRTPGDFTQDTAELLQPFASQSALALINARLFRELERKSGELPTRAGTSPSSWPACPTSSGRRSTR